MLLLVVGCFMEALAAMLVLIPILVPPALALGIDPVQFGLVFVLNLMIGTITPPVGVVLYVTAKVADVRFEAIVKSTLPYPGAAARRARADHAVAAAHDVAAEAAARALSVVVRDNSRHRRRAAVGESPLPLCRGPEPMVRLAMRFCEHATTMPAAMLRNLPRGHPSGTFTPCDWQASGQTIPDRFAEIVD